MNASDLFKQGQLAQAIDAQIAEVKSHPADHAKRLFLFELLVFNGDLERARKHLDIIKFDQVELEAATEKYRRLLDAEQTRRQVFDAGARPHFLDDVPLHAEMRLEAVLLLKDGKTAEAAGMMEEAQKNSPVVKGVFNEKTIEGLCDCDPLLGNILEVVARGQYCWVPVEQIETLDMNPPRFPRDLIWSPARLEMRKSAAGEVFLPAIYPSSYKDADERIKLGRITEFSETAPVLGKGGKLFLAGDDAVPLLEWRELKIEQA
jgi:type VI secretion system protein ImpE